MWGNQVPRMVLAFVPQDIMFGLIDFCLLATCSESRLWPHTGEGDPGLGSKATLQCVHVSGTFVR